MSSNRAGAAYRKKMREHDHVAMSPLTAHLNYLRNTDEGAAIADELTATLRKCFATDDGIKSLMLLEKSVLVSCVPNGSSDSALREMNAARNLVLDLRRIASNV